MQSWYRFLLEMSHKTGHINATFISVHSRLLNSRMAVFASQSACSLHQLSVFIPGAGAHSISEICLFESAPDMSLSTLPPSCPSKADQEHSVTFAIKYIGEKRGMSCYTALGTACFFQAVQ